MTTYEFLGNNYRPGVGVLLTRSNIEVYRGLCAQENRPDPSAVQVCKAFEANRPPVVTTEPEPRLTARAWRLMSWSTPGGGE